MYNIYIYKLVSKNIKLRTISVKTMITKKKILVKVTDNNFFFHNLENQFNWQFQFRKEIYEKLK